MRSSATTKNYPQIGAEADRAGEAGAYANICAGIASLGEGAAHVCGNHHRAFYIGITTIQLLDSHIGEIHTNTL